MKRKLTDTYVKTFQVTSKVFTLEEVRLFIKALAGAVKAQVPDRAGLARIFADFDAVMEQYDVPTPSRHEPPPTATPSNGSGVAATPTSKGVTDYDVDRKN